MIIYGADISGSLTVTGSVNIGGSLTANSVTGSFSGVATTASLAFTASSADSFTVRQNATASNMLLTGTLVAQTINVQQVTSSIVYSSGSNRFGNQLTDVQQMTGSLRVTGSGDHYIVGGNVGVGTASPTEKLDVSGRAQFTNNGYNYVLVDSTISDSYLRLAAAGTVKWYFRNNISNSHRLEITSDAGTTGMLLTQAGAATFSGAVGIVGAAGTNGTKLFVQGSVSSIFDAAGTRGISFYPSQTSIHFITSDYIGTSYYPLAFSARGVNNDLYLSTGGEVGIGTPSPSTLLDVRGELSVAYNATYGIRLYNQDRNNWSYIGNSVATGDSSANLRFGDSTGEVIRITGGRVGIGTTTPSTPLQVNGRTNIVNKNGYGFAHYDLTGSNNQYLISQHLSASNGFLLTTGYNGTSLNPYFALGTNDTAVLTISGSNVGIGTTSPADKLEISNGTYYKIKTFFESTYVSGFKFSDYNGGIKYDAANDRLTLFANYQGGVNASEITFETSGSEKMRIDANGNVGIGTTSPGTKLEVSGSINASGAGGMGLGSIAGRRRIQWDTGANNEATILGDNDGYAPIGASAFNNRSDYRLKEDLKDFNSLPIVLNMKVYDFKWKDREERNYGMIAHEAQKIIPYIVSGEKDAVNEENHPSYQGIDYSKLSPILIKAIQELKAEINSLKAEITQLKSN